MKTQAKQAEHPIKIERTRRGWTQRELGQRIGVTKAAVCRWERRVGVPEPPIALNLSRVLDLSLERIYAAAA